MKVIMKKIVYLPILVLFLGVFGSCQKDDSLDPRPLQVPGLYVRLDITSKVLKGIKPNVTDPALNFTQAEVDASFFGGLLTSPSGNVVKYNLYVKRRDPFSISSEFVLIKTITSFPSDLKITLADIATALNIDVSSVGYSDEYYFYGEAFDKSGNRADYYSLSSTVQGAPGMKQAFRFRTTCLDLPYFSVQENLNQYDNYVNP